MHHKIELQVHVNYSLLLGHVRALCPGCLQCPQNRARLAGGSSVFGAGGGMWDWTGDRVGGGVGDGEGED